MATYSKTNVPRNAPKNEPITAPKPKNRGDMTIARMNENKIEENRLRLLLLSLPPDFKLKKNSNISPAITIKITVRNSKNDNFGVKTHISGKIIEMILPGSPTKFVNTNKDCTKRDKIMSVAAIKGQYPKKEYFV